MTYPSAQVCIEAVLVFALIKSETVMRHVVRHKRTSAKYAKYLVVSRDKHMQPIMHMKEPQQRLVFPAFCAFNVSTF